MRLALGQRVGVRERGKPEALLPGREHVLPDHAQALREAVVGAGGSPVQKDEWPNRGHGFRIDWNG